MVSNKFIEIFIKVDDFTINFEQEIRKLQLETSNPKSRNRKASLCDNKKK